MAESAQASSMLAIEKACPLIALGRWISVGGKASSSSISTRQNKTSMAARPPSIACSIYSNRKAGAE
jgi:hypothetical protein